MSDAEHSNRHFVIAQDLATLKEQVKNIDKRLDRIEKKLHGLFNNPHNPGTINNNTRLLTKRNIVIGGGAGTLYAIVEIVRAIFGA